MFVQHNAFVVRLARKNPWISVQADIGGSINNNLEAFIDGDEIFILLLSSEVSI